MCRKRSARADIFRKTALTAFLLEVLALFLSMLFTRDILKVFAGLLSGYAAGLVKLYFTFGAVCASSGRNAGRKFKITPVAGNVSGYALLAAVLVFNAGLGKTALVSSMAGIFNVYLGILAYMSYTAARSKKEKKDGLE